MVVINIKKKDLYLISALFIFLIGSGYVIAYNPGGTGNPAVMGHSFNELEGVQARVIGNCSSGNAIRIINADGTVTCQVASAGVALPSGCASNQVAKWNGVSWICSNDIDTDTKCNTAYSCNQICVEGVCKTSWDATICTWESKTYSTGAVCTVGSCSTGGDNTIATCQIDGSWKISGSQPWPCPNFCGA